MMEPELKVMDPYQGDMMEPVDITKVKMMEPHAMVPLLGILTI